MGLKCGIVGLPNVGKSTLFNALTQTQAAEAANYPFCTIDPNVGVISVPDFRLNKLAEIAKSQKIIPTQIEFIDIAGLVKGASQGEGLGNQFLAHIRSTDAIIHVLRCFENDDITHVDGCVDPLRDLEIVETELMLADIESLEKRINGKERKAAATPELKEQFELMKQALEKLNKGESLRSKESPFKSLGLFSDKPVVLVCNVSEEDIIEGNTYSQKIDQYAKNHGLASVMISASIESEIAILSHEQERIDFLQSLGLTTSGLTKVIHAGYKLLNLETFFTAGPTESRAWSIKHNTKAPDAAAEIHTDFKKGFICAEIIHYDDYVNCQGELGAKNAGKMHLEGRDYIVQDGDVVHFRFNV